MPKNVPYFTVRRADFAMPEVADLILEKFGEDRGDGVVRLYRFPVVFPADAWQAIMPHALMCYGASQLKYWSEYSPDGRERYCMTFDPVPVDGNGKRTVRIFGGRKHVVRAENGGRCDPETCAEYQAKQCNLTGRFIFLIPGIPSINADRARHQQLLLDERRPPNAGNRRLPARRADWRLPRRQDELLVDQEAA